MNSWSPTALAVTLRLIREAKTSSYTECLVRETKAALNRIYDTEFKEGSYAVQIEHKPYKWGKDPTEE